MREEIAPSHQAYATVDGLKLMVGNPDITADELVTALETPVI